VRDRDSVEVEVTALILGRQHERVLRARERLLGTPDKTPRHAREHPAEGVVRTGLEGAREEQQRRVVFAPQVGQQMALGRKGQRVRGLQRDRARGELEGALRLGFRVLGPALADGEAVPPGRVGGGEGERRVLEHRLFQVLPRLLGGSPIHRIDQMDTAQHAVISGQTLRTLAQCRLQLARADIGRDARDDLLGDAILQIEHLGALAFARPAHICRPVSPSVSLVVMRTASPARDREPVST
jgi:hypothetical protein